LASNCCLSISVSKWFCTQNKSHFLTPNKTEPNSILCKPKRIVWLSLKENERKEHLLNITEITYASPQNVTALYQEQIDAMSLGKVIEKHILVHTHPYLTNTHAKTPKKFFYFKGGWIYQNITDCSRGKFKIRKFKGNFRRSSANL
jgi:hypothetical protein